MNLEQSNPAPAWLAFATRADIASELDAVYTVIADQVAARGPTCWASGRCCNFEKAGHRLYTTGLEAAYCVARLPGSPVSGGPSLREGRMTLSAPSLALARIRGDCPFLESHTCGVHTIKPAACRVYFCEHASQSWQHDLAERSHAMIRALHERHAIEYRYAEWRELLAFFVPKA